MKNKKAYVYLVGAGPGDPGLITVKGMECIKKADVLVYDRLVNPSLLDHASKNAELIYVGKSPERHTLSQEEINSLLVAKASENKIVTRLKGGDPFVFGRGGEEALELVKNKIPFEIVPGITSAIAVPAYAGIPVTHRGLTSNAAFITGNEDPTKEDTDIDWAKISTGIGTLVFLMGMANLPKIVEKLMEHGRSPDTPVALIRWGTLPEQVTLTAALKDIVQKAEENKFKNPAIIIVGEVVSLREELKWVEKRPLWGQRVLVTRSRDQASIFSKMIQDLGGEPIEFPTIDIIQPDDYTPLDKAIAAIEDFDWIIFTSVNGVQAFYERLLLKKMDFRQLKGVRICAIGPKTREELEKYGLLVDYVPGEYRAEAIIEKMQGENLKGKKILLPRADIARKILPESLKAMGADVHEVTAYKTVKGNGQLNNVKDLLVNKKINIITFTSSSTVKNFISMFDKNELPELLKGIKLASIGPITTRTAVELGLSIDIEAAEYTLDGLLQAILVS
ncbi:MAG: uroporphyrinogen-III C-methyltransferase [Clostridia bacterium]|nr:uroporphyrinogen-III C-methyltransferase [Clostridia bacterium]